MNKNAAFERLEDLVLFKGKTTPEQQVKELDEKIEDLKKMRQKILDDVDKKYVDKMLERVMGKWIAVGGWVGDTESDYNSNANKHYSIFKVVKAVQWHGGNSFTVIARHLLQLSGEDDLNGGIYPVDANRKIEDLNRAAVLPASKVAGIIRRATKNLSKRLSAALEEAEQ